MTGRHQGLVTQLDEAAVGNIYRVWCGAHQFDLLMQAIFVKLLHKSFMTTTQRLSGYLRRQQTLIREMRTKCPRFIDTRWLSMGRLLTWLIANCLSVQEYLDLKNPDCKPQKDWWVMVFCCISSRKGSI